MKCIITAFPSSKALQIVKESLVGSGICVNVECKSGAEVLRAAAGFDGGIVICSSKIDDILVVNLCDMLPETYDILVLISEGQSGIELPDGVFSIVTPVNRQHLINTVMMLMRISKRLGKRRKDSNTEDIMDDKELILQAKEILMNQYFFTEKQAYRFIQKRSMDNGTKMTVTAKLILSN